MESRRVLKASQRRQGRQIILAQGSGLLSKVGGKRGARKGPLKCLRHKSFTLQPHPRLALINSQKVAPRLTAQD